MSRYHHLTLNNREYLLVGLTLKQSYRVIAQLIGCSQATILREVSRNGGRSKSLFKIQMIWYDSSKKVIISELSKQYFPPTI